MKAKTFFLTALSCALLLLDYLEHGMDAEPFLRTYDLINIRTVQP